MIEAINQGRERFYDMDDQGNYVRKATSREKEIRDYERVIKHPLTLSNAYLTVVPNFELMANSPLCELHALSSGFLDHIVQAVLFKFSSVLRSPELVRDDGRPLISEARLGAFSRRLQDRFRSLSPDECMVNVSPSFVDNWKKVFLVPDSGARMTGDQYKLVMLLQGFLYNDLLFPEVCAKV